MFVFNHSYYEFSYLKNSTLRSVGILLLISAPNEHDRLGISILVFTDGDNIVTALSLIWLLFELVFRLFATRWAADVGIGILFKLDALVFDEFCCFGAKFV